MGRFLVAISDALGRLVYTVLYIPVWLAWHLAGKHVVTIIAVLKAQTDWNDEFQQFIERSDLPVLKQMLLHAYYNTVMREKQEELLACGRSV